MRVADTIEYHSVDVFENNVLFYQFSMLIFIWVRSYKKTFREQKKEDKNITFFVFSRINVYFCAVINPGVMNYEELLASRNGATMKKDSMPFGSLYRKISDESSVSVVDLRNELSDSLRFCEALKSESQLVTTVKDRRQIRFHVTSDSSGLNSVVFNQGNCHTFERLIEERPAIVAEKGFVWKTMKSLVEFTTILNSQGIYHVCFSPSNILVRKSDNSLMLLFHGSSYMLVNDQEMLYAGCTDYVAPEVLEQGVADARSDVYSLGKFLEYLYHDSNLPLENKVVIRKATNKNPDKRYQSAAELLKAMRSMHSVRVSVVLGIAAVLLALLVMGVYVELFPDTKKVDFVEAVPHESFDDEEVSPALYDPDMELEAVTPDSNSVKIDEKQMQEYEAKAEQIFRKRYAAEAERILSKIYDNEHMNSTEKNFISSSTEVMKELTQKQVDLGSEAGLTDAKSQRIASEIIERISNSKKAKLEKRNVTTGNGSPNVAQPTSGTTPSSQDNE